MSTIPIHGGKGSRRRPLNNKKEFDSNWDKIFNNKKEPTNDLDDKNK